VWRHDVDTDPDDDVCVYTEDDERFEVFVRLSPGGAVSSTGPIMPTVPTAATCTWSPTTTPPSSGW
jgi:hypothetical protein